MVSINGSEYTLCLFDTNALSELLLNPKAWIGYVNRAFGLGKSVICYSAFTVAELWSRQELFEKFIEVFAAFPSVMLDGYKSILDKEIINYGKGGLINPIVVAPFAIQAPGLSPKEKLFRIIEQSGFVSKTKQWKNNRQEILDGMLSRIRNYPPKSSTYSYRRD